MCWFSLTAEASRLSIWSMPPRRLHQGLPQAQGHATRGGLGQLLGGGRPHQTARGLQNQPEGAQAHRGCLWLDQDRGGLAKTKLIGQAKLTGQALLCFTTYNLVRMGSIGGWWDAHHA
jgi:hypothetical protein